MEKINDLLKNEFYIKNKMTIWTFLFLSMIVLTRIIVGSNSEKMNNEEFRDSENFSTFIPKGYSLVPIDVVNYKSLDSVLGQFGTVDVFTKNTSQKSSTLVKLASNVKALRSQAESSNIAVLVPTEAVLLLLSQTEGLFLALSSSENSGTIIEKPLRKFSNRKIILSN